MPDIREMVENQLHKSIMQRTLGTIITDLEVLWLTLSEKRSEVPGRFYERKNVDPVHPDSTVPDSLSTISSFGELGRTMSTNLGQNLFDKEREWVQQFEGKINQARKDIDNEVIEWDNIFMDFTESELDYVLKTMNKVINSI